MRNIKLTIEYDGRDFGGWQKQKIRRETILGKKRKCKNNIKIF